MFRSRRVDPSTPCALRKGFCQSEPLSITIDVHYAGVVVYFAKRVYQAEQEQRKKIARYRGLGISFAKPKARYLPIKTVVITDSMLSGHQDLKVCSVITVVESRWGRRVLNEGLLELSRGV